MRNGFRWIPFLCFGVCSASTQPTPCIPEGQAFVLTFQRPDLSGSGFPGDATWASSPGWVIDNDVFGMDDVMGSLTQRAGNTFAARFRNVNGAKTNHISGVWCSQKSRYGRRPSAIQLVARKNSISSQLSG